MRSEDLFVAIGMVNEKSLVRCDKRRAPSVNKRMEEANMSTYENRTGNTGRRSVKKLWIIAAIVGLMLLLMGCVGIIRYVSARSILHDYPVADGDQIDAKRVHLSVEDVTATSMRVYCVVDGIEYGVNSVEMIQNGPYTIEKKKADGWEVLSVLREDPLDQGNEVLSAGELDWLVDWSGTYGILSSGTYRYTATVVEGVEPISVEFTVNKQEGMNLQDEIGNILNAESYCVRFYMSYEYGSLEKVSDQVREYLVDFAEVENASYGEYWKHGDDLLYFYYRGDKIINGMMYKDGIKYSLDFEGDNVNNPVIGWSQHPDLELDRLTGWVTYLSRQGFCGNAEYSEDGSLRKITVIEERDNFQDNYKVDTTITRVWEIVTTEQAMTEIGEQDVNVVREFSWKEDQQVMKALNVQFNNTTVQPIATASEAIDRAMAECTVEYEKILVYRDADEGMWKVEYQILYGYQGYQYVYLDDDGITRMVSGAGSKVEEWKDLYPDP